ncbi:NUDIX hydrolase [Myxococcota bacterium]|nr:NUDIX hydrolase [Myxococcota bacterium]
MKNIQELSCTPLYDGKLAKLNLHEVELPNGSIAKLEIIDHPGASAVVPVDGDGNVLMVRQYRHAAEDYLLEVPAGKLEADEDPALCATREMEEEIGYRATEVIALGHILPTPGYSNEKIWLFLARGLEATQQNLDEHEVLSVQTIPLKEAKEMALDGNITDAKTIAALLRACTWLDKEK